MKSKKIYKDEVVIVFTSAMGIQLGEVIINKEDANLLLSIDKKLKHTNLHWKL